MAQETAVVEDVVGMGVMVGMVTVVGVIITTTATVVATTAIHPMADMVAEEVEDFLMAHTKENLMTHIRRENTILHDQMCLKSPMSRLRTSLMRTKHLMAIAIMEQITIRKLMYRKNQQKQN